MFWTTLKWGATTLLVVVFGLAMLRAAAVSHETQDSGSATRANPPAPQDNPPPKKFNF